MAGRPQDAALLKEVRTLFGLGVVREWTDGQLLGHYLRADDREAEGAFTALVERHGPMVLHVCRQVLDDPHDAQDAFQATFLVLLRRAESIRKRDSVASWLFGVALRVARRARYAAVVRRFHERRSLEVAAARDGDEGGITECLEALHAEIARLPPRYREPIVLCHLEGLATADAAQRLGCAQGTILSRLARARDRLRRRLIRRGLTVPAGLLAAHWVPREAAAARAAAAALSTVQAAWHTAAGRATLGASVSPPVAALTRATLRALLMTRLTLVALALTMAAGLATLTIPSVRAGLGAGSATMTATDGGRPRPPEAESPTHDRDRDRVHDLEDAFYRLLKRDHELNDPKWPFLIKVRDVQDRTLIDATFKHRAKGKDDFDLVIQARRAVVHFDLRARIVQVDFDQVEVQSFRGDADVVLIDKRHLEFPIPPGRDLRESSPPGRVGAPEDRQVVVMRSDQALALACSPDGKTLASAGFDGVVHLWDLVNAKEIGKLKGEEATIRSVTFSPDGKTVASANDAGFVKLWDGPTGTLLKSFPGLSESMRRSGRSLLLDSVTFTPDGRRLAASGIAPFDRTEPPDRDYEVRVLDVRSGEPIWSHMGHGDQASSLTFTPDSRILACGGSRAVKLWDAQTGEPIRTLYPAKGTIFALACTPDGRTLIGGGNIPTEDADHPAGLVTLWEVATGRILRSLEGHGGGVHAIAIAPDGKTVASGGNGPWRDRDGVRGAFSDVRLWELATGKLLRTIEGGPGVVRSLVFTPDGRTLVSSDDRAIVLIDVRTGRIERDLKTTTTTPRR
jgi:RNA polymerase sigma factor (sigma-70 family)